MNEIDFFLILFSVVITIDVIFTYLAIRKRRSMLKYIGQWGMVTKLKCPKCGCIIFRPWKRGDFVMADVECFHDPTMKLDPKYKKCHSKMTIESIYLEVPLSKRERKYKELCDKWR